MRRRGTGAVEAGWLRSPRRRRQNALPGRIFFCRCTDVRLLPGREMETRPRRPACRVTRYFLSAGVVCTHRNGVLACRKVPNRASRIRIRRDESRLLAPTAVSTNIITLDPGVKVSRDGSRVFQRNTPNARARRRKIDTVEL